MSEQDNMTDVMIDNRPEEVPEVTQNNAKGGSFWKWVFRLRSIPLAIPVIVATVILALRSMSVLPDTMLIGTYELTKARAVFGPVGATAACLLMMFLSKRVMYPWIISIFTLVLPVFLQIVAPFLG